LFCEILLPLILARFDIYALYFLYSNKEKFRLWNVDLFLVIIQPRRRSYMPPSCYFVWVRFCSSDIITKPVAFMKEAQSFKFISNFALICLETLTVSIQLERFGSSQKSVVVTKPITVSQKEINFWAKKNGSRIGTISTENTWDLACSVQCFTCIMEG
jgi:hypothetical protein